MKFRIGQRRSSKVNSFENILPDIIHEFDLEKSFTIEEIAAQWSCIVGDIISTHSKPDRINKNVLFVAVDHSVYSNELIVMKDVILQKIRQLLPFLTITNIRAEIKKISW